MLPHCAHRSLDSNSIDDAGAVGIAEALAHNTALTSLTYVRGVMPVPCAVARHTSPARACSLVSNSLSDAGIAVIGRSLTRNDVLQTLRCDVASFRCGRRPRLTRCARSLNQNAFSDTGAEGLATGLIHNHALRTLKCALHRSRPSILRQRPR